MHFVDEIKVYVRGGKGGDGQVGWRREAHRPRGGPDGGHGGNGGAVIFAATDSTNTLIDFAFQPHLFAENGENGSSNDCIGKSGTDLIVSVPVGCQVYYNEQLVADLSVPGARWVAARGGVGGKGNAHFKTATRQAPDFAQPGQPGDEVELKLVLKSVADVGLVGLPNVGKSTLISKLSAATPKIASYPFTTLHPHLGVVTMENKERFVVADIPGLIPGASSGKGLGIKFLKHVERTKTIAHLIDVTTAIDENTPGCPLDAEDAEIQAQALEQFRVIDQELREFSNELADLPRLIVFSKGDLLPAERAFVLLKEHFSGLGFQSILISSHHESGLAELKSLLLKQVRR